MFPKYECYIAAGSHVDVGNDENDRALTEEYARSRAQITVVYTNEFFKLTHWFAPGTNPVTCQRLSTWPTEAVSYVWMPKHITTRVSTESMCIKP